MPIPTPRKNEKQRVAVCPRRYSKGKRAQQQGKSRKS